MLANVVIYADFGAAQSAFSAIADSLDTGFEKTFKEIGKLQGAEVDANFLRHGRPDVWAALAPTTVAARERRVKKTGKEPVAGLQTQLRVDDTLRKAASAASAGTEGSEVVLTPWGWQNTLTLPYAAIQDQGGTIRVGNLFGIPGRSATITIPARPFFFFQQGDEDKYTDLVAADIEARIQSSTGG